MKKLIQIAALICLTYQLQAQSIEEEIISATGHYFQDASIGNLHGTVGEIATETLENGTILTQGFHQFYLITTPVFEQSIEKFSWNIYPNPTTDMIQLETDLKGDLLIELLDLNGRQLRKKHLQEGKAELKLRELPDATYLLKLSKNNKLLKSWKVQKMK